MHNPREAIHDDIIQFEGVGTPLRRTSPSGAGMLPGKACLHMGREYEDHSACRRLYQILVLRQDAGDNPHTSL